MCLNVKMSLPNSTYVLDNALLPSYSFKYTFYFYYSSSPHAFSDSSLNYKVNCCHLWFISPLA